MAQTAALVSSLDVLPVDVVDPVIHGIKAELDALEQQLRELLDEASELESDVSERRRASTDERRAVALLESVLRTMLRTSRDELDAAVERARYEAETTVGSARRTTDDLLADATTVLGGRVPAAPDVDAPVRRPPVDLPRWSAHDRVEAVLRAASQPYAAAPVVASSAASPPPPPAPVPAPAPAPQPEPEPAPSPLGPRPDTFVQFWNGEPQPPKPRAKPRFEWVDAVLPVVAVAILLIVVLSYFG